MQHKNAIVQGYTPKSLGDISNVWDFAEESQTFVDKKQKLRKNQIITLPNEPVGVAIFADLHLGSGHTNYSAIRKDIKTIETLEGAYVIVNGDLTDNWIIGKLQALQRGQAVSKTLEDKLFLDFVRTLKHKFIAWCSGNHDEWTTKLCGWSPAEEALKDLPVLYDPYQVSFALRHGENVKQILLRHKWRYSSIYNPTHPIEVGWDRGDIDFDIGIGGHTHIGTYCRPFHRHGKRRYAILTGTYKTHDQFGEELGFACPKDSGSGILIFIPGQQDLIWFDSLEQGADFLRYLRGRFKTDLASNRRKRNRLVPVFESLNQEIRQGRKERQELIRVTQGKAQVPLNVVIILVIVMSSLLLLEKIKGHDVEITGEGLGIKGQVTTKKKTP